MMTGNDGAGKIANRIQIELGSVFEGGYAHRNSAKFWRLVFLLSIGLFLPCGLAGLREVSLRREFSPPSREAAKQDKGIRELSLGPALLILNFFPVGCKI